MIATRKQSTSARGGRALPFTALALSAALLAACGGGGGSSGSSTPGLSVSASMTMATYGYTQQPTLRWTATAASQVDLTACTTTALNATNIGTTGTKQFAAGATAGTYTCTLRATALDGGTATKAITWTVNPPEPSTLVASVPAPSYVAGDGRITGFNYLNGVRGRCGWGLLKQDTHLDQAAIDHAHYMAVNMDQGGKTFDQVYEHTQTPGWLSYTGVSGTDRATYRGYPAGYVGDQLSGGGVGPNDRAEFAQVAAGFVGSTYHGFAALAVATDTGIGYDASSTSGFFVLNIGAPASIGTDQRPAGDTVQTYPCEGETNVPTPHFSENVNPLPSRDWNANPVGTPILIAVRPGHPLTVTSVTMAPEGGAPLTGTLITSANDVNHFLQPEQAAWLPNGWLQRLTRYSVTIKGTNGAVPFTKSFTFTTWDQA